MNKYMEKFEDNVFKAYNRAPIVFEKGEDVYLYDTTGKKYLDFVSGIGVVGLGYSNEKFKNRLKDQIDKITHTSNLYYNTAIAEAAEKIVKASKMSKAFFTNSGAEAIEGALKAAKKYAYENKGEDKYEIIAFNNSFHGRTIGSLSITGTESYRKPFMPLLDGVKFAEFNDIESVKNLITENTIAIVVEPIQGEGGINVGEEKFFKEIEKICKEKDIILILDEIQCGVGRTGDFYKFHKLGIKPDIVTTAKALGNGIPVGAFLLNDKMAENSLKPGDHGTTYGGNPLAGAAVSAVLDIFEEDNILDHVNEISIYFEKKLMELKNKYDFILEVKGEGLIRGLKLRDDIVAGDVVNRGLENGLTTVVAGGNVLRFLPPLVIEEKHVDEMIEKLEKSFK
ncbi:aspartate aminotransferase family protein [Anaerosphaera multitolerans]|uniref:Acetylornithine aminotransferase n=1 Tax=Anaerosphaera multitolerans TaxID=2487351 RepID=A0A437S650_9FIRM|nr:aspartate aminotransferase family protein [Anaerosphaera multitolerans]RVU54474.1 aspartate aminotransferase family protein [Anaerosphaera multitolerans]